MSRLSGVFVKLIVLNIATKNCHRKITAITASTANATAASSSVTIFTTNANYYCQLHYTATICLVIWSQSAVI